MVQKPGPPLGGGGATGRRSSAKSQARHRNKNISDQGHENEPRAECPSNCMSGRGCTLIDWDLGVNVTDGWSSEATMVKRKP